MKYALTQSQKNRLTRLARKEASRLEDIYFDGLFTRNGGTSFEDSRGARLRRARENKNYSGMLQFIPKKALRNAGINIGV